MKIRSITLGVDWRERDKATLQQDIRTLCANADDAFAAKGMELRTRRIVLPPFTIKESLDNENITTIVGWLSELCANSGIRWFCVPFDTFGQEMREVNSVAIEIAKRFDNAFINLIVATDGKVNRKAILHSSKFIKSVARLSNNGYDNFRVGASFNCRPNGPFFPFTYHQGNDGFSIAMELVPLFIEVIEASSDRTLEKVRDNLLARVGPELAAVDEVGRSIEQATGIEYLGTDASLAPYPDSDEGSVARIVELLGVDGFGSNGTIFLTSFLTDIIRELVHTTGTKTIGFNGVMYSLLEDTRLGINNSSQEFSIDSMLAFSTVCGCGVDMVPVPGDIFEEEIASIMMDVAAISTTLRKPLGVRLLPIPGKHEFEFTDFSYDFLHNTRIQKAKHRACFTEMLNVTDAFTYMQPPR